MMTEKATPCLYFALFDLVYHPTVIKMRFSWKWKKQMMISSKRGKKKKEKRAK